MSTVPEQTPTRDVADEFAVDRAAIEQACDRADVVDVLVALNPRARAYLAAIADAAEDRRDLLIQMTPPGTRQVLELHGALQSRDGDGELALTDFGAAIAAAAARLGWQRARRDDRSGRAKRLAASLAATAAGAVAAARIVRHDR